MPVMPPVDNSLPEASVIAAGSQGSDDNLLPRPPRGGEPDRAPHEHDAKVEHLLDDIEKAVVAQLWLLAVTGALLLPDVAGALAHPSGEAKGERYRAWWDSTDLKVAYGGFLSSADAYHYRCALAHQSTGGHPKAATGRVLFLPPAPVTIHKGLMQQVGATGGHAIALDIRAFVADVVGVARHWLNVNRTDSIVSANLAKSVRFHPNGLHPFIVGSPVVG